MKGYLILAVAACALIQLSESQLSLKALRPKYFKPTAITNGTRSGKGRGRSASTKANQPSVCGETMVNMKDGDHGYIESPNYPDPYKAGIECLWTLKAAPGLNIFLTVFDIRTFSDPFSDAADSVFISLLGEWEEGQTQRFSGDLNAITPIHLVTQGSDLLIRFKSSALGGNQRGFKMGYEARKKPPAAQPADDVYTSLCPYVPVSSPAIFPDHGQSKRLSSRSFCGKNNEAPELQEITRINPTPYLVALVLDDKQFCSGALIENNYVVTSGHCASGAKKIDMLFGGNDLSLVDGGVQKRSVDASAVTVHPEFSPKTGLNDISIIKLSEPVKITRFVRPAQLPSWELFQDPMVGVPAEVAGWGESDGKILVRTSNIPVRVSSNAVCRSSLHKGMSGMLLCVAPRTEEQQCSVDSGSPIATQCNSGNDPASTPDSCDKAPNILLGVMSFGSCGRGYAFTRLTAHLDFISQVTGAKLDHFASILE